MRAGFLNQHLFALKKVRTEKKDEDAIRILSSLRGAFFPWFSFTTSMLPLVNAKIAYFASRDQKQTIFARELGQWENIRNTGLWIEDESGKLDTKINELIREIKERTLNGAGEKLREFIHYLEELHDNVHQADLLIRKLLEEFDSHAKELQAQLNAIQSAKEDLLKLEEQYGRAD